MVGLSAATPALAPAELVEVGRDVMRAEARAIECLAGNLEVSFAHAAQMLHACRGAVIVSGMGKAGLIGRKLAATLASTGTRSFFLHPAEAIHGDLGSLQSGDVVLMLSFSGHTEEVVRILPALQQIAAPLIAITGQSDSPLARHAAITLHLGPIQEAGRLGLAPTASTAAMLAIGDALALAVAELRGHTENDFARNHPGGNLGRKLARVEDVMRPLADCRVATEDQTLRQTLVSQSRPGRRSGAIIVKNAEGILSGVFTDSDLARLLEANRDAALDRPLAEVMTHQPTTICVGATLSAACEILSRKKISELPVIDQSGQPVGMIDITDVVGIVPEPAPAPPPTTKPRPRVAGSRSSADVRLHNPDQ